jgi:uncharacterized RDD family membrane protein YckC
MKGPIMDFSEDAKREIEKNLGEFVRNINLDDKEREEMVKELRSTYYERAESEARTHGADKVSADDVRAANANVSSPRETADSFMKSYATMLKRGGFWSRLVAFVIDCAVICTLLVAIVSPLLVMLVLAGMPMEESPAIDAWFESQNPLYVVGILIVGALTALSALVIILGYYVFLEGHFGHTVGKKIMGLQVLRTDGTKIGYKEAILRNLSKYINNLIVVDTLIMLIFFYKEKQRGLDRMADTIVIHSRK